MQNATIKVQPADLAVGEFDGTGARVLDDSRMSDFCPLPCFLKAGPDVGFMSTFNPL